ncbi:MAG: leucyl aminopeptidase family protein [Pseudomonadota bacterium]
MSPLRPLDWPEPAQIFQDRDAAAAGDPPVPVYLVSTPLKDALKACDLTAVQHAWIEAIGFRAATGEVALVPGVDGTLAKVLLGLGDDAEAQPCGPKEFLAGALANKLPKGTYAFAGLTEGAEETAALAFGLGAYRFAGYTASSGEDITADDAATDATKAGVKLQIAGSQSASLEAKLEAVWLGRDLINTPASDLGPAEISNTAEQLAHKHGAAFSATIGDDLLAQNFPMIHAVGRASPRDPRLVDFSWAPKGAKSDLPTVTLVGKGISFDTGGLDLKPAAAMLLMKKDMGGAATVLTLAHLIMSHQLPIALRVLIATAENSVSGNAFRPGDVLKSRLGKTVEVGNTDAEGRLVLADALALADEDAPDRLISFATLTGAARVALGPDLPAFFSNDDDFAARVCASGIDVADPVWRMPFWNNYDRRLKSQIADMNNISDGPFAGAITAALFLKRFVSNARSFAHIDLYGWKPAATVLGPKGGEPGSARAVFRALQDEFGPASG